VRFYCTLLAQVNTVPSKRKALESDNKANRKKASSSAHPPVAGISGLTIARTVSAAVAMSAADVVKEG